MESFQAINQLAITHNVDVLFLSETWHTRHCIRFINYLYLRYPWTVIGTSPLAAIQTSSRQNGGLLCLVRTSLLDSLDSANHPTFTSFENAVILSWNAVNIACLYLPPSLPTQSIQQLLDQCVALGPSLVILGDLNARLGGLALDSRLYPVERALCITNFMQRNRLVWRDLGQLPNHRPDRIQHLFNGPGTVFIGGSRFKCPQDAAHCPLSDHPPFVGRITIPTLATSSGTPNSLFFDPSVDQFFVKFLDHNQTRKAMSDYFALCTNALLPTEERLISWVNSSLQCSPYVFHARMQDLVDHLHSLLLCCLQSAAIIFLGRYKVPNLKILPKSDDLRYLESCTLSNTAASRLVKRSHRNQAAADGTLVSRSEIPAVDDVWEFYDSIYSWKPGMLEKQANLEDYIHWKETDDQEAHRLHLLNEIAQESAPSINQVSQAVLSKFLKSYPEHKAKGLDGISPALLKKLDFQDKEVSKTLAFLYSFYYWVGKTPKVWNDALVTLIPKSATATPTIESRRPISVTSIFRRLFEQAILPLLQREEHRLHASQAGFRRNSSVFNHLLILHEAMLFGKAELLLVDLKQAYDRVDTESMIKKLTLFNPEWNPALISVCRSLYCLGSSIFLVNGQHTKPVIRKCGLIQGGLLSPFLFNVFINDLCLVIPPNESRQPVPLRLFADDIAVLRFPRKGHSLVLQDLQRIEDWCSVNCMHVNRQKSVICMNPTLQIVYPPGLPVSSSVKYLGIPFKYNGIDVENHLASRLQSGLQTFRKIQLVGYCWPHSVKLYGFKAHVRPSFEYGLPLVSALSKFSSNKVKALINNYQQLCDDCIKWIFQQTSKPSRLHYSLLGLPLSFLERASHLEASFNLHLNKISPEGSELLTHRQRMVAPFPALSILPRIPLNSFYRAYARQLQVWISGPPNTSWMINESPVFTKILPRQNPPRIQDHLKAASIIQAKHSLKMASLIDDDLARTQNGLGHVKTLTIPLSNVRRLALQWRLNKFGHQYCCPVCCLSFTRSCVTDCHLLDQNVIPTNYWQVFHQSSVEYQQVQPLQAQEFTILDYLLNINDWRLFGKCILHILQKLTPREGQEDKTYAIDHLEEALHCYLQSANPGHVQRVAPALFEPP